MPFSRPVKVIASISGSTPYIASGVIIHSPTEPTNRPDGSSIQEGDFWNDTTYDVLNIRIEDDWKEVGGGGANVIVSDVEPPTKENGLPLVTGDFWYDSVATELYVYIEDAFQSVSVGGGGAPGGSTLTFSSDHPIRHTRRGDNIHHFFNMDGLPVMNHIYP